MYEPVDCSRSLVIISGNLDEAFQIAGQGSEADVEADVFAEHTAKITVVDIKDALLKRFKPEQVARFGNIHLIYTSLRRADFVELIERETTRVIDRNRESFGVAVEIDESLRTLIYRNGVFPVQGVRPVFSSVADILETNLAKLVFTALLKGEDQVALTYDVSAQRLLGLVGSEQIVLPYSGRIDRIREASSPDKVANIAVHEAGHAVMYGILFGLAPRQLTARVASAYVSGFTVPHAMYETAGTMIDEAKICLAGGLAEELIFGAEHASIGRDSDRERATRLVIDVVRRYGFDAEFQAHYMLDRPYKMDTTVADPDIEKMITRLVAETRSELATHQRLIVALAHSLAHTGSLGDAEVAAVLNQHGVAVRIVSEGHLSIASYSTMMSS
jgi:hypothetical protein